MNEALWALGRASGVVLLGLLTVVVLLGLLTRSGRPLPGLPRFAVALVHRDVALLSLVFLVVHVVTLLLDPYAQLTLVDTVVPFLKATDPVWLGLGTVGLDLMLAVTITALLRRWIGRRAFVAVHRAAYLLWPVGLLHAIGDGSDAGAPWFAALGLTCTAAVVAGLVWRSTVGFVEHRRHRLEPTR
jgi:methionine sulfoxide reductase heme-binding subunit